MAKLIAVLNPEIGYIRNCAYVEEEYAVGSINQMHSERGRLDYWPSPIYSSYYVDKSEAEHRLLWLHRMHDRIRVLEDLTDSRDYVMDYYYNGYDEMPIYAYEYGSYDKDHPLHQAVEDLREYNHMVEQYHDVDTAVLLNELIIKDAVRENGLL